MWKLFILGIVDIMIFTLFQFYIALLIIFLLQMVGAVLIFVFKDKVKTSLVDAMNENLVTRYHDDQDSQNLIDWFQENVSLYIILWS